MGLRKRMIEADKIKQELLLKRQGRVKRVIEAKGTRIAPKPPPPKTY
jgi:hypothetical protein